MRSIKLAAAIWFGLLAMGVGIELLPFASAQEQSSQTVITTEDDWEPGFPAGVGYLGGTTGFGSANNGLGAGVNFGGDLAFFPSRYLGLGALFRGSDNGDESRQVYGGQLLLRPVQQLQLGLLLGGASVDDAGESSGTSFAYGGKAGYDFRLGETPFTFGPEVNLLFFKPGPSTITDYSALASFKIWI